MRGQLPTPPILVDEHEIEIARDLYVDVMGLRVLGLNVRQIEAMPAECIAVWWDKEGGFHLSPLHNIGVRPFESEETYCLCHLPSECTRFGILLPSSRMKSYPVCPVCGREHRYMQLQK